MSDYILKVQNNDGVRLLDATYQNYNWHGTYQVFTDSSGQFVLKMYGVSDPPMIMTQNSSWNWVIAQLSLEYGVYTVRGFVLNSAGTVGLANYRVNIAYFLKTTPSSSSGVGVILRDATNRVLFNSVYKPLRVSATLKLHPWVNGNAGQGTAYFPSYSVDPWIQYNESVVNFEYYGVFYFARRVPVPGRLDVAAIWSPFVEGGAGVQEFAGPGTHGSIIPGMTVTAISPGVY